MPRNRRKKPAYAGSVGSGGGGRGSRNAGSRRSVVSLGGSGHAAMQEEIRRASQAAERAKMSSLRRNKTFIQIKRDMEDRRRHADKAQRQQNNEAA